MMRWFELHAAAKGALHRLMNATIMTVAWLIAIKAVKRNMQAKGLKLAHVEQQMIVFAANKYPEVLKEAAETVRKVPQNEHPASEKRTNVGKWATSRATSPIVNRTLRPRSNLSRASSLSQTKASDNDNYRK
jgi:hypothetical protein